MKGNFVKVYVFYVDVEFNDQVGCFIKVSCIFIMKCFYFFFLKCLSIILFMNLLFVDKNFNIYLEMKLF